MVNFGADAVAFKLAQKSFWTAQFGPGKAWNAARDGDSKLRYPKMLLAPRLLGLVGHPFL
jgi:hypothetical protein